MAKITKRGGASVRTFQSPAQVLRQRGKLGPYGGEAAVAKVETFTVEAEPAPAGEPEVDLAAVRAWAADNGIVVSPRGRVARAVVDQYLAAQ
jgi:hypothetical protein